MSPTKGIGNNIDILVYQIPIAQNSITRCQKLNSSSWSGSDSIDPQSVSFFKIFPKITLAENHSIPNGGMCPSIVYTKHQMYWGALLEVDPHYRE